MTLMMQGMASLCASWRLTGSVTVRARLAGCAQGICLGVGLRLGYDSGGGGGGGGGGSSGGGGSGAAAAMAVVFRNQEM